MTTSPLVDAIKNRVAAEVVGKVPQGLALAILDAIDEVAAEFEQVGSFATTARVSHREAPTLVGTVQRRIETDGELHTVAVVWDGDLSETLYSPRELRPAP